MRTQIHQRASAVGLLLLAWCSLAYAQAPSISKVEPPNWWIGLPDPMLMITGQHLAGARVTTTTPGARVIRTLDGQGGLYEFVWLEIGRLTAPGKIVLDLAVGKEHCQLTFPVAERDAAGTIPNESSGFNGFGPDDVIYLIMPDRFADGDRGNNFPESPAYNRKLPRAYHGGDLRGIQEKLPYLKDLGVTAIWITPVYQNDDRNGNDYHGYGATDFYAVEKQFGTIADYQVLVKAAHTQGIKVLLDIVPNHVGPTNPWVSNPPTERWFHGTPEKHLTTGGPFAAETDPHSLPTERRAILEGWFADTLPDLATDDPITAQYLRQNALWWAETGALDGFRIDTFPYVDRPFWRDFHAELHRTYPRFRTVGEVSNPDPTVTSFFIGGRTIEGIDTGVDTVFDFPLESAIRKVILHDSSAKLIDEVLRQDWMFPHPESLVTFIGNHDETRFMGEVGATVQKLKLALSLLLTLRGIPQIYYGDEIAMPGGEDPDNRHDFPGGFLGDKRDAFSPAGRAPAEQEVFTHVRDLLHLRREHSALRRGELVQIFADDQTLAYVRHAESEQLLIVMNNADQPRSVNLRTADTPLASARTVRALIGTNEAKIIGGTTIQVSVDSRSIGIYQLN